MSNLTTRLGLVAGLMAAATFTSFGCHSTLPSIFLAMEDPTGLSPQQLRVTVRMEGQASVTVLRPETPGEPMEGTQTMRLLMPDAAIDQPALLTIEALIAGEIVGSAETVARVAADAETRVSVALLPGKPGCVGLECGCNATTCPSGCCDGNTCVQGSASSCGTGGNACAACPPDSTDRCLEGACRCGPDAPCPEGYACESGSCVATGPGPACSSEADCTRPPSQCHEAGGRCTEAGTCSYDLKSTGTACDDGDSCTETDACNAQGLCVGVEKACRGGSGCLATEGACVNGTCLYEPLGLGETCSDGNNCTVGETCNGAGSCTGGVDTVCNAPPEGGCFESVGDCTAAGTCTYRPKQSGTSCGTNTACTTYACDGAGACVPSHHPSTTPCGEETACTTQTCNGQGACVTNHKPSTTVCGASTECTDYRCSAGTCAPQHRGSTSLCGTNNACRTSVCNGAGGCAVTDRPVNTPCGSGTACVAEVCNGSGACVNANRPNGTDCPGDSECRDYSCQNGACVWAAQQNGQACGNPSSCQTCSNGSCGGGCSGGQVCMCGVCQAPGTECN